MKRAKKLLYLLVVLVLLAVFLYSGIQLWRYYAESHETQSAYDELSQLAQQARPPEDPSAPTVDWNAYLNMGVDQIIEMPENPYSIRTHPETGDTVLMLPEFEALFDINPDIVGWITIADTHIDYPVVQRKDKTDYYLYRDFYGRQVMRGCIYVKEECDVFTPSDNIVIYGHMMQDSTMFADLHKYTSKAFWQEHRYIQFDTLRARNTYEIICVFKTTATAGKGFSYHLFETAASQEEFDAFWAGCAENALYDTGLTARYGDKLITLSTCEYTQTNGRLVVVAKRIDPTE